MVGSALFSKKSDEWATPQLLFNRLNDIYKFTLDPCATAENAKCEKFYTKEQDGLKQSWVGERVFCNPPYSQISLWVEKSAVLESELTLTLIPVRTDTKWFHQFINKHPNIYIEFIKGRLKFGDSKNSAPFPSMLVLFSKEFF